MMTELEIARIHAAADFEALRASNRNLLVTMLADISTVMVALARPVPKLEIGIERLDAMRSGIAAQIRKLEALK